MAEDDVVTIGARRLCSNADGDMLPDWLCFDGALVENMMASLDAVRQHDAAVEVNDALYTNIRSTAAGAHQNPQMLAAMRASVVRALTNKTVLEKQADPPASQADRNAATTSYRVAKAAQDALNGAAVPTLADIMQGAKGTLSEAIQMMRDHGVRVSFNRTWVIPVHVGACHWVLALVRVAAKTIQLLDPLRSGSSVSGLDHMCMGRRTEVIDALNLLMRAVHVRRGNTQCVLCLNFEFGIVSSSQRVLVQ